MALPKWVISNEESVWRETERSREMTAEERWSDVVSACGMLKLYWGIEGYADRVRCAVDPLPESSVRALERLRTEYKKSRERSGAGPTTAETERGQ